jgi:hypothetical protein
MPDGGYYLNYVRYLVQAFAPLGCKIVVAVPRPALEIGTVQNVSLVKMYLSPHRPHFRLEFIPSRKAMDRGSMVQTDARVFREVMGRVKPDAVYGPTLERMAQSLAWWLACVRGCYGFTARRRLMA